MKKLLLAAISLTLIAAFFFLRAPSPSPDSAPEPVAAPAIPLAPPSAAPAEKLAPASPTPSAPGLLPESARAAARECLGEDHADWPSLARAIEARAAGGKPSLQWRVLKTEENGREIRIRLAREPRESGAESLSLKLFSVDEDGLPELLPARPGQAENAAGWLSEYLRGKTVTQDSRLEEITLPGGRVLSLETEGKQVIEAQFQGPGKGLACSRKGEDPSCRCL